MPAKLDPSFVTDVAQKRSKNSPSSSPPASPPALVPAMSMMDPTGTPPLHLERPHSLPATLPPPATLPSPSPSHTKVKKFGRINGSLTDFLKKKPSTPRKGPATPRKGPATPRKGKSKELQECEDQEKKLKESIKIKTDSLVKMDKLLQEGARDLQTILAEKEYVESLVNELREREEASNNELQIQQKQTAKLIDQHMNKIKEMETLNYDMEGLQVKYENKKNAYEEEYKVFCSVYEKRMRQMDTQEKERKRQLTANIEDLEIQVRDIEKTIRALERRKEAMKSHITSQTNELAKITTSLLDAKEELDTVKRNIDPKLEELAKLSSQAKIEEKRVDKLVHFFMQTEQKLERAQGQLEKYVKIKESIYEAESECKDLKKERNYLQTQINRQKSYLEEVSKVLKQTINASEEQKHKYNSMVRKNQEELERVRFEVEMESASLRLMQLTSKETELITKNIEYKQPDRIPTKSSQKRFRKVHE